MANPHNSTTSSHAFWLTKLPFLSLALLLLLLLCCTATPAIPSALQFLFTESLRLCAAAQPWLSPPYLFLTVHLIILLIWKLSDQVKPPPSDPPLPSPPLPQNTSKPSLFNRSNTVPIQRTSTTFDRLSHPSSPLRRSKSRSPRSAKHENHPKISRLERRGFEFELDKMEGKFMKENSKDYLTPAMDVNAGEEDSDELNRRFDEFIKKKYDQMRLESFRRRTSETRAE